MSMVQILIKVPEDLKDAFQKRLDAFNQDITVKDALEASMMQAIMMNDSEIQQWLSDRTVFTFVGKIRNNPFKQKVIEEEKELAENKEYDLYKVLMGKGLDKGRGKLEALFRDITLSVRNAVKNGI